MAISYALKQRLGFAGLALLAIVLITLFRPLAPNPEKQADQCMQCHQHVQDMSVSHPIETFGCAVCHLGNALAADEQNAHAGMVRNPSDLLWADRTCGQSACHPELVSTVRKSIMNTNTGLVASTLIQWQESNRWDDSTQTIDNGFPDSSLATSHLRKLCAGCHVNKRESDLPGEFGQRGGGCNDCHLVESKEAGQHPTFTVQIPTATCEKCHNRSNRTALSYQGKFESERYGTPFNAGNASNDTLSGGRYFYHLPADVHFEAGMSCIDCHAQEDVMGDGKRHAHLETQVHIKCADCHTPKFARPNPDARLYKIVDTNKNLKLPADSLFLFTQAGTYLANVIQVNHRPKLIVRITGKLLDMPQNKDKLTCNMAGHERLSCQACHTAYIPQCYGCHDLYDPTRKQLDKVSYQETEGHWSEGRSYLRFEDPPLLLDQNNKVMPGAPGCQVFLTDLLDSSQAYWPTFAAFDPHNTRKMVAPCESCHSNPKRLGLGPGTLITKKEKLRVHDIYDAPGSGLGVRPLEQFVDGHGQAKQRMSRQLERPFTRKELERIIGVSLCLVCHDTYEDPIYSDYMQSLKRYQSDDQLPCRN